MEEKQEGADAALFKDAYPAAPTKELHHDGKVFRMDTVESSQLVSVGHLGAEQQLAVEFKGGAVYLYDNVPPEMFEELKAAESKGKFFMTIKKNPERFPFKRVRDTDAQEAKKAQTGAA